MFLISSVEFASATASNIMAPFIEDIDGTHLLCLGAMVKIGQHRNQVSLLKYNMNDNTIHMTASRSVASQLSYDLSSVNWHHLQTALQQFILSLPQPTPQQSSSETSHGSTTYSQRKRTRSTNQDDQTQAATTKMKHMQQQIHDLQVHQSMQRTHAPQHKKQVVEIHPQRHDSFLVNRMTLDLDIFLSAIEKNIQQLKHTTEQNQHKLNLTDLQSIISKISDDPMCVVIKNKLQRQFDLLLASTRTGCEMKELVSKLDNFLLLVQMLHSSWNINSTYSFC